MKLLNSMKGMNSIHVIRRESQVGKELNKHPTTT
eukprot:CAMPEP_0171000914 /NCGR_PEP_ID=MMETSP0736-20130129/15122_1 /TAXON_ID=186038 /ORGANISM="Fragilariopsis kerguelensis, Strain L26-C5" /LENGTH=33 /DNA_ID= /DNA_START= /DNA_END= /DNA_ORIENTATION=